MTALDIAARLRGLGARARCQSGVWRITTRTGRVVLAASLGDALAVLLGGAS